MANLYYTCDWIIRPIYDGRALAETDRIAGTLDCHILAKDYKLEKGYYVAKLVIQAPSEEVFRVYLEQAKAFMELENCRPATEEAFVGSPIFPPTGTGNPLTVLNVLGMKNQQRTVSNPSWFTCNWAVHPLTLDDLENIFKILDRWDYSVYYRTPENFGLAPSNLEFVVQVSSITTIQAFVDELRPYISLTDWTSEHSMPNSRVDLSDLQAFNAENKSSFLKSIGKSA